MQKAPDAPQRDNLAMTSDFPILSLLIFLPLCGALLLFAFRRSAAAGAPGRARLRPRRARAFAAGSALRPPRAPRPGRPPASSCSRTPPGSSASASATRSGMDGISLVMVLLTAFITVIAVLVSWNGIKERVPLYFALLLAMETGIQGVFLSLDLFLFYLFWEAMLIPMFFLIGIWGHGRRIYSAVKFFLYTFFGLAAHAGGDHLALPDARRPDRQLHLLAGRADPHLGPLRRRASGSLPPSSSPSPSSSRSSRCTPGSPMPTPTPRPPAA